MAIEKILPGETLNVLGLKYNASVDEQIVAAAVPSNGLLQLEKKNGQKIDVAIPKQPNAILSGLGLSVSGATATVQPGEWQINGVSRIKNTATLLAIDPLANAALSRIDAVVADNAGAVTLLKGTESANPATPSLGPLRVLVGYVFVTATGNTVENPQVQPDFTAITKTFPQFNHGFVRGDALRYNGTAWVGSLAVMMSDTDASSEVYGVVSAVADADTFTVTMPGWMDVTGLGLAPGTAYFLSPTVPGKLTIAPPTQENQVVKPVLLTTDANTAYVVGYIGEVLGAGGTTGGGTGPGTPPDLSAYYTAAQTDAQVASAKAQILAGVGPAYDTLLELFNHINSVDGTNDAALAALLSNVVFLTGNQEIDGIKTFVQKVITPLLEISNPSGGFGGQIQLQNGALERFIATLGVSESGVFIGSLDETTEGNTIANSFGFAEYSALGIDYFELSFQLTNQYALIRFPRTKATGGTYTVEFSNRSSGQIETHHYLASSLTVNAFLSDNIFVTRTVTGAFSLAVDNSRVGTKVRWDITKNTASDVVVSFPANTILEYGSSTLSGVLDSEFSIELLCYKLVSTVPYYKARVSNLSASGGGGGGGVTSVNGLVGAVSLDASEIELEGLTLSPTPISAGIDLQILAGRTQGQLNALLAMIDAQVEEALTVSSNTVTLNLATYRIGKGRVLVSGTSLTVAVTNPSINKQYILSIVTGSNAVALSLPETISYYSGTPTLDANSNYDLSLRVYTNNGSTLLYKFTIVKFTYLAPVVQDTVLPLDYDTYGFDQSTLVMDLDPTSGLVSSGGLVDSWTCKKSGLVFANTGANRPTLVASSINGKPAIAGDGVSKTLFGTNASPITVAEAYIVFNFNSVGNFPDFNGIFGALNTSGPALFVHGNQGATTMVVGGNTDMKATANQSPLNKYKVFQATSLNVTRDSYRLLNDRNVAGRFWNGNLFRLLAFSSATPTVPEQMKRNHYLHRQMGRIILLGDGNSIMAFSGTLNGFLEKAVTLLGVQEYASFNFGVGGQTTVQMTSDVNSQILDFFVPYRKSIYIPFEITNDLYFGVSQVAARNNYIALCQQAKTKGYKVVACTILPRSNSGTPSDFEANRQAINQYIRTNYLDFSHALADFGANATIGSVGAETNTTYYSDLVHPNSAGNDIMAPILQAAVASISF